MVTRLNSSPRTQENFHSLKSPKRFSNPSEEKPQSKSTSHDPCHTQYRLSPAFPRVSPPLSHGVKPGLGHSLVPGQPLIPTIKLQALDFIRCFRETRPKSTVSTSSGGGLFTGTQLDAFSRHPGIAWGLDKSSAALTVCTPGVSGTCPHDRGHTWPVLYGSSVLQ